MSNEIPEEKAAENQPSYPKSHEHFNPVVVTDTVGALFLGVISIVLMAVVGVLLKNNRELKNRLNEILHSLDQ